MQSSDIPARIQLPFAGAGGRTTIPVPPTGTNAASFSDGFPPTTRQPLGSGGVPPNGLDMNGILYITSAWDRWQGAGGSVIWDSAFSAAIGGYPLGCVIQKASRVGWWQSTVENNATNPDLGGAGWVDPLAGLVATTAFTGSNQSLVNNGYQKLPGGYIRQWGRVHVGDIPAGSTLVTAISYPIAFPTAVLGIIPGIKDALQQCNVVTAFDTETTAGFNFQARETSSLAQDCTLFWEAWGN